MARFSPLAALKLMRRVGVRSSENKLNELLKRVTRLNRDVEQIKLMSGTSLGSDRGVTFLASGDRIHIDPRDRGCGMNLLTEGKYEEEEISLFKCFLKPGATVLDIGSNYGYYAVSAAPYLRPGGTVYAFEPNPHIFELMRSSAYINGYTDIIKPCRAAVYDSNSALRFAIDETGPGGARVVADDFVAHGGIKVIDVPVVVIDEFLSPDSVVDLVKIDVEGREQNVLRGMEKTIQRSPDIVILMELFYSFFQNEPSFAQFINYIESTLKLNIFKKDGNKLSKVQCNDLLYKESYVLLSKRENIDCADLTIYPSQLNRTPAAILQGSQINWKSDDASSDLIAHGPYVYLPKGGYRMEVFGEFSGQFRFQVQENYGDIIWRGVLQPGSSQEFYVPLRFDAPRMEVAIWAADHNSTSFRLDRIEFHKV